MDPGSNTNGRLIKYNALVRVFHLLPTSNAQGNLAEAENRLSSLWTWTLVPHSVLKHPFASPSESCSVLEFEVEPVSSHLPLMM